MPTDLTRLPPATDPDQFSRWVDRGLPGVTEMRPGVWSVSIPFQGNPMRLTYCYLLAGPDGLIVIDPGWDSDEGWETFRSALAGIGYRIDEVAGIVVTHFHPDHYAMADRARTATGAWLGMHPADIAVLQWQADRDRMRSKERDWLSWAGAPGRLADDYDQLSRRMDHLRWDGEPFTRLVDGQLIPTSSGAARVLHTPGHTPGHLCLELADAGLLFSGDHILPKVSPTMGIGVDRDADPLADYLSSLRRCADLGDLEVAPAHEYRFRGLTARAEVLIAEHLDRLAEVQARVESGAGTLWEVAEGISWRRDWAGLDPLNQVIALMETECHLVHLARTDRIDLQPYGG